jgi:hypothetical protein
MRRRESNTTKKTLPRFVQRKKVLDSPLGGLQVIADNLNDLPDLRTLVAGRDCDPLEKENCETWTLAETIVSEPSLSRASKKFNRHAQNHPVTMFVEYPVMGIKKGSEPEADRSSAKNKEPPHTAVASRDAIGTALWHLWLFYFQDYGWERLKRCAVCPRWFVDMSKNRKTARCSSACTWKWWSRDRRKNAGHRMKGTKPRAERRTRVPVPPAHVDRAASPMPLTSTELKKLIAEEAHRDEVYMQGLHATRTKTLAERKEAGHPRTKKGGASHGTEKR